MRGVAAHSGGAGGASQGGEKKPLTLETGIYTFIFTLKYLLLVLPRPLKSQSSGGLSG